MCADITDEEDPDCQLEVGATMVVDISSHRRVEVSNACCFSYFRPFFETL